MFPLHPILPRRAASARRPELAPRRPVPCTPRLTVPARRGDPSLAEVALMAAAWAALLVGTSLFGAVPVAAVAVVVVLSRWSLAVMKHSAEQGSPH